MSYQLVPLDGGDSIRIAKTDVVIGRSRTDADIQLPYRGVSKRHCRLTWRNGSLTAHDLNSRNGTWLNSQRVECAEVFADDEIAFGTHRFRVRLRDSRHAGGVVIRDDDATDADLIVPKPTPTAKACAASSIPQNPVAIRATGKRPVEQRPAILRDANPKPAQSLPISAPANPLCTASMTPSTFDLNRRDIEEWIEDAPRDGAAHPAATTKPQRPVPAASSEQCHGTVSQARSGRRSSSNAQPAVQHLNRFRLPRAFRFRPFIAAILGVLAICWWLGAGFDDSESIELCRQLHQKVIASRTSSSLSPAEWKTFSTQSLERVRQAISELELTVNGKQPRRQALLYALRDGLCVMLAQEAHRQRNLSESAQRIEKEFEQNLRLATGELSFETAVVSTNGTVPTRTSPY